jgi:6,7-dimethyl-8-ribityllumazine synthase
MATALKNLSQYTFSTQVDLSTKRVGIVTSEWNEEVTGALYEAARETLLLHGVLPDNIVSKTVPGSYELSLAAQWLAQREDIDAVICLGCVVQGETRHFDFICAAVAKGITDVSLRWTAPEVSMAIKA